MLKKIVKNNYLIFFIVITFVFISCFLSAFIPSAFADDKKDPKEKTTPVYESSQPQGPKFGDISDPLNVLQNITNSFTTKTTLATSKIVYDMKSYLKQTYPDSSKYVNKFMDCLYDEILNVDNWEEIKVDHFTKETFDSDSFKDALKVQLNFVFAQAYSSLTANIDQSCQFLLSSMKSFYPNAIISTVQALWYPKL
ncbi:MAG: hypothetical protein ACQBVK_01895 [Candidatus Phytoplasma sp. TWB_XP]